MSEPHALPDLLAGLELAARELPVDQVPSLLGVLERIRAEAFLRAVGMAPVLAPQEDTALNVEQAARLLGIAPKTLANGARSTYAALRLNTGARALRFSRARVLSFREADETRPALVAIASRTSRRR